MNCGGNKNRIRTEYETMHDRRAFFTVSFVCRFALLLMSKNALKRSALEAELTAKQQNAKKLRSRLATLRKQQASVEEDLNQDCCRIKELQDELTYEFTWLVPESYQDLSDNEKQYNKWCKCLCDALRMDWKTEFRELTYFKRSHIEHGWKRILGDVLANCLTLDPIGLIAGYCEESEPYSLCHSFMREESTHQSEAREAMYQLWCMGTPFLDSVIRISREFAEISSGLGSHQIEIAYNVEMEDDDNGDTTTTVMEVVWDENDSAYTNNGQLQLDEILTHFKSSWPPRQPTWSQIVCMADQIDAKRELLPLLFLMYFADELEWQDEEDPHGIRSCS